MPRAERKCPSRRCVESEESTAENDTLAHKDGSSQLQEGSSESQEGSSELRLHLGFRALLSSIALLACGPLGPLPGGELDGEPSSSAPVDWSFSQAHETIQLEVRPNDPYSVNVWCVTTRGKLYVGAGEGESSFWARALLEEPEARLRIGTTLYDVIDTRMMDTAEIEAFLDALAEKYEISDAQLSDFQTPSDERPSAVLFRLDSPL